MMSQLRKSTSNVLSRGGSKSIASATSDEERQSSSSDETEDEAVLRENDIKLHQMRRVASKKRNHRDPAARPQKLQTLEEVLKSHAVKRMQEGVRKLLALHTPVELSGICGCLLLKTHLKGSESTEQIVNFIMEGDDNYQERIKKVLSYCWEGALWEYLHTLGHPIHSMMIDPKITVFKVWETGGFLHGKDFAPHFIAREVKKRNEWIQSEDIQERLIKLLEAQEYAKQAERKIISDHDYTNILHYFNQMHNLRNMETTMREFLISELEVARSRLDSYEEIAQMQRDRLAEHEVYLVKITQALNERLAHVEYLHQQEIAAHTALKKQLYRMNDMICSYIETDLNRDEFNGGILQPLKLKNLDEEYPPSLYIPKPLEDPNNQTVSSLEEMEVINPNVPFFMACYQNLQTYRQQRNARDDALRERTRCHVIEINELKDELEDLHKAHEGLQKLYDKDVTTYVKIFDRYIRQQRGLMRHEITANIQTDVAWSAAIASKGRLLELEVEMKNIKPILVAGMTHSHPVLRKVCWNILTRFKGMIKSEDELKRYKEQIEMANQERYSIRHREYQRLLQKQAELNARAAKLKNKKGAKGSPSKKSTSSGKNADDSTVKSNTSASVGPTATPAKAAATSGKGGTDKKPTSAASAKKPGKK